MGRLFVNLCPAPLSHLIFPAGDISSISGSDSESSDASSESEPQPPASSSPGTPRLPRSHKVLLRNASGQLISAYRCVLSTGKASHGPAGWEGGHREKGAHQGVAFTCLKGPGGPLWEGWVLLARSEPQAMRRSQECDWGDACASRGVCSVLGDSEVIPSGASSSVCLRVAARSQRS